MLKIVKASAGSGKTYTLVKEYLKLALRHPEKHFKHILAITFTNKAANEMKARVLEKLEALSELSDKENHLINFLCKALDIKPNELQNRSKEMLQAMLHSYADVAISTIDSFTHQVIRGFAYELKLNMNVEIELNSEEILKQVVDVLIDEIEDESNGQNDLEKRNISKALIEFATSNLEDGKSLNIEYNLFDFSKNLLTDETYLHRETLENTSIPILLDLRKDLKKFIESFKAKSDKIATDAIQLIEQNGLADADFYYKEKGLYSYFKKLHSDNIAYEWAATGNSYHRATIYNDKWGTITGNDFIKNQLKNYFEQLTNLYSTEGQEMILANIISKNIYSFMLLRALNSILQNYKDDNNLMLIGEFQHRVFSEVRGQPAPAIYERVGGRFDNIMIDEFQDTSVMQWHNLVPLIDNAVSNMQECMIVGDAKQAIYRFRGGEVKQFSLLPDIYGSNSDLTLKEYEINIKNHQPQLESLEYNFRSCNNIIDFNNRFYEMAKNLPELKDKSTYKEHAQKIPVRDKDKEKSGGNVIISFLEKKQKSDNEEIETDNLQQTKIFVEEALHKNYKQRDIAVLVQTNNVGASIASFLIEHGFNVISPESLNIAEADSVRLLECALNYLNRSDDVIIRAELLLTLKRNFYEIFDVTEIPVHGSRQDFEKKISEIIQQEFSTQHLLELRLFDLLNQLNMLFNLNLSKDPFVQFFLDEVLLYSQKNSGNIQYFLEWWEKEKSKKSIIYPDTLDAIRVMTVHKSKGLEFPVVIIPDANYSTTSTGKQIWVEIDKPYCKEIRHFLLPVVKDLEKTTLKNVYEKEQDDMFLERLNLLYVATTRPTDLLYIITEKGSETKSSKGGDKEERLNNLGKLFKRFVEQENIPPFEENNFKIFDNETLKQEEKESAKILPFAVGENIIASGDSVLEVRTNPRLKWKQSKLDDIAYGNLLHALLSKIEYADEAAQKIDFFLSKENLEENLCARLKQDVANIINHTALKKYFSAPYKIFNESGMSTKGQLKFPDRVMLNEENKTVSIIDYKTGEENAAHKTQVNEYKQIFDALGFKTETAIIFYTQHNLLISV